MNKKNHGKLRNLNKMKSSLSVGLKNELNAALNVESTERTERTENANSNVNSGEVVIVGDVHGDLNQFIYPLLYFIKNYDKCEKIVYLGDYIDRGESNVYIYEILKKLIDLKNTKFEFLRGNHESYDCGVYDYMNVDVEGAMNSNTFIKTFLFDKFHNLDLDLIYYDKRRNLLFSHSPMSRGLDEALKLNDNKTDFKVMADNTYTDEKECKGMEYRNIHGHIHKLSPDEDIKKFINGEKKMISIDGDASYGIRLVMNSYKKTRRWTEDIETNINYLILNGDSENMKYKMIRKKIGYGSEEDFNTKSFEWIKNKLIEEVKGEIGSDLNGDSDDDLVRLKSVFEKLSLKDSIDEFKKEYLKMFSEDGKMKNVVENLKKLYSDNLKRKGGVVNIYFHDIPIEIYQKFGYFKQLDYIPIYKLYWFNVLGLNEDDNDINRRYRMTGGKRMIDMKKMVRVIVVMMVMIICIISLILVSIKFIRNKARKVGDGTKIIDENLNNEQ